ncbi:hypothetical protein [Sansalvadorimonas verongulae]|uniref:hypothetical protein n=1 Tax=Sansalvadorimonas verongulae TaxID=2172824 RepID=UPI0012BC01DA|nr:hypothetical protein [Sansalvadorimonas verongulae]MTI14947.1 hypothetical protein [Sansalvadorimonas verongulae]
MCGENAILNSLPFHKRYEFVDHAWTVQDSLSRLGKEESLGIVSLMLMLLAGQGIVNTVGDYSRPLVSLGLQTVVDYALSHHKADFLLRSGTNAVNYFLAGDHWGWRQLLWFSAGHSSLLNVHWRDLRAQLHPLYDGQRRIHFTSETLDLLFALTLEISGSGGRKSGQLIIRIDQFQSLPDTSQALGNKLEYSWLELFQACRQNEITSISIRPAPNRHRMIVQFWWHERLLSENDVQLELTEGVIGEPVWLTDWLIQREWPEGWQIGFEPLILPLTDSVLDAITNKILQGLNNEVVPVVPVSGGVAPEGRMAVFSTGDWGYLLVDRNQTKDVELPEMWLNTSESYSEDIKLSLAQLEAHRIPGRERGRAGLGFEALRSFVARGIIAMALESGFFRSSR